MSCMNYVHYLIYTDVRMAPISFRSPSAPSKKYLDLASLSSLTHAQLHLVSHACTARIRAVPRASDSAGRRWRAAELAAHDLLLVFSVQPVRLATATLAASLDTAPASDDPHPVPAMAAALAVGEFHRKPENST